MEMMTGTKEEDNIPKRESLSVMQGPRINLSL